MHINTCNICVQSGLHESAFTITDNVIIIIIVYHIFQNMLWFIFLSKNNITIQALLSSDDNGSTTCVFWEFEQV